MTRRAKAPESVRAWSIEWIAHSRDGYVLGNWTERRRPDWLARSSDYRPVRVRIVRESDYRRLLRAAAGKREAKRAKGKRHD
jgi:hypothetical protein